MQAQSDGASGREICVREAAAMLKVSMPYLLNLLHDGGLPHRIVNHEYSIPSEAIFTYRQEQDSKRRAALEALTIETQELEAVTEL